MSVEGATKWYESLRSLDPVDQQSHVELALTFMGTAIELTMHLQLTLSLSVCAS